MTIGIEYEVHAPSARPSTINVHALTVDGKNPMPNFVAIRTSRVQSNSIPEQASAHKDSHDYASGAHGMTEPCPVADVVDSTEDPGHELHFQASHHAPPNSLREGKRIASTRRARVSQRHRSVLKASN